MELTSVKIIKDLVERHGFNFSKGLGQNFLVDRRALDSILDAAELSEDDWVLEVGPGVGVLTQALAERVASVTTVEIDHSLLPILHETLSDCGNIDIVVGDILKVDISRLCPSQCKPKAIANLPYYITTPAIFRILDSGIKWNKLVFLIQKEVAERFAAKPGSKIYGAPSVTLQARAKVRIYSIVKKSCFIPQPTVSSAILTIEPYTTNKYAINDFTIFSSVVRTAFNQRRKTLANGLGNARLFGLSKNEWIAIIEECRIDPNVRAEMLGIEAFASISNSLAKN